MFNRVYWAVSRCVRFALAMAVVLFFSPSSEAEGPTFVGSHAWFVRPDLSTSYPYTDDPLQTQSTPIRRIHLTELRVAVDNVRQQAGLATFPWTDPQPVQIRAVHVTELRAALSEAFMALERPAPVWSEPAVSGGTIKARHFQEIRDLTRWEASGTITTDTTWLASNSPYVVQGEVTVNGGARLTIAPGTIVKFSPGARLQVLEGSTLIANGTPTQPIFFTSLKDDTVGGDTNRDGGATLPGRGDWGILAIGNPVAQTNQPAFGSVTHAVIRYGGQFVVRFSAPALHDVSSTYMNGDGLYLESPPAGSYTLENLTLTDNVTNLVLVNVHGSTTIQKSIVRRASGVAIRATDNTAAHLIDNSIDENRGSVAVQATNSPLVLQYNSITRNHPQDGVARGVTTTGAFIDARYNWWGAVTGPTHVVDGKGQVGADTSVDPWLGKDWAEAFKNGDHPWALKAGVSVDVASGNLYLAERDFVIATVGFPLEVTRTYNSKAAVGAESDFGFGWTWNYGTRLRTNSDPHGVVWQREDGTETYFKRNPDNTFSGEEGLHEKLVWLTSGSYRMTSKDQSSLLFSSEGYLTAQVDASGNTTTITRNGSGRVIRVSEPAGRELTFEYSGAYISKITDPLERTFRYERNPNGAIASVVMRDRLGTTYGVANYFYGPGGRWEMLRVEDVDGNLIDQSFDSSQRVSQQRFNNSAPVSFAYCDWTTAGCSPQGTTVIEDMRDRLHEYRYTPSNKVTDHFRQQVLPGGGYEWIHDDAWSYTGYLVGTYVGLKGTTASTYDWDTGNLTKVVEPGGRTTTYTYDAFNNRTSVTDHLGRVTRYEYDAKQHFIRVTDALGRITRHEYDARGLRERTIDPLDRVTSFSHDQFGYPLDRVDALGHATHFTYDAIGRKLTETNPFGERVSTNYDGRGNAVDVTDPLGNRTSYTYDLKGRKTEVRDAAGRVTKYEYSDTRNALVKTTDALGGTVELTRDDFGGNVTAVRDARGNSTSFAYDDLNRKVSETDSLGRTWRFEYMRGDLLANVTDAKGARTVNLYDSSNRLAQINYPDGTSSINTYDGLGNRTKLSDWTGETTWTYDALNRVTATVKNGQTTGYSYDAVGNLAALTYPGNKTVSYAYDEVDRLKTVTDWAGRVTAYSNYDLAGRLQIYTYPNGVFAIHGYDAAGRLTSLQYSKQNNVLRAFTYEYDSVGNRKLRRNQLTGNAEEGYAYDPLYRLTEAYYPDDGKYILYSYDAAGNRTLMRQEPLGGGQITTIFSGTYDAADQLQSDGSVTRAYDLNGAQTVDGTRTYAWNAQHLLSQVSSSDTTSFVYDGDGRRVRQTKNGVASDYVVDATRKISEVLTETTLGSTTYYIYGHDLLYTIESSGPHYLHADGIGSTLVGSNDLGQEETRFTYDVFGAIRSVSGSHQTRRRFTGEESDDSGLIYLRARYYDAGLGRFISRDPFPMDGMDTQSLNRYVYVKNNPTNYVDPSGEYALFDDLAFAGAGLLLSVSSQALHDIVTHTAIEPRNYAAAAAGGFVGGWASLYATPVGGGAIGGAVSNYVKQSWDVPGETRQTFNFASLATETLLGAASGLVPGARVAGLTKGSNSYLAVSNQLVTKLRGGTIASITSRSAGKMVVSQVLKNSYGTMLQTSLSNAISRWFAWR